MGKTVNYAKWRKRQEAEGTTTIDFGEHGTVTVLPPILWPPVLDTDAGRESNLDYTRRVVGEEGVAIAEAAGCTVAQLAAILMDRTGAEPGE